MTRSIYLPLMLSTAALLSACGSKTQTDTQTADNGAAVTEISSETDNGVANTSVTTPAMSDQDFLNTVAASDAFEIQAGKMAEQKATTKALKDIGKMMVDAHTQSTANLKKAAAKAQPALTPDATLSAAQQSDLDALGKASGADFDRLYKDQQVAGHQKALAGLEAYQQAGATDPLKDFAKDTIPVVKSHLDKLNAL